MKRSLGTALEIKKNRLRRRSRQIIREVAITVSIICMTALLGTLMVYGYNFAICSDYFTLRDTTIRGTARVSEGEVLKLSGLTDSTNILTANMDKMIAGIKTNPWVKEVRMGRELPNRLVIEIEERTPVALISHEKNIYLLDSEGTIFKNLDNEDRVDIPVMTGFSDGGMLDEELLRGALELLNYLSERKGYPEMEHISEIRGHHLFGYSLCTTDRRLYILGFDDYEKKISRLRKVLFDLSTRNVPLSPLLVNLVDPGRIVVRHGDVIAPGQGGERKRTDI